MEGLVASKALILDMAHDCKRSCLSHTVPHISHTVSHTAVSHRFTLFTHIYTAKKKYSYHEDKKYLLQKICMLLQILKGR